MSYLYCLSIKCENKIKKKKIDVLLVTVLDKYSVSSVTLGGVI